MYEDNKLASAAHFLFRMEAEQRRVEVFRFELSAFLSEARSVLQYALDDAKRITDGQGWYDRSVGRHSIVKFFKELRDESIHAAPVKPNNDVTIREISGFGLSTGAHSTAPQIEPAAPGLVASYVYRFAQDPLGRDALQLCRDYLAVLREIVADGRMNGFLS